nr:MAG TPA: hypothetical protein [Caudoviricetes sp.]
MIVFVTSIDVDLKNNLSTFSSVKFKASLYHL